MGATAEAPTPAAAAPPSRPSPFPGREDCWSEEATFTLIDAWGSRYLQLNRGNLRQSDWQEVAAAVNLRHGHDRRSTRTDVQCKNRIDTLKKKYKVERARVSDSSSATGDGAAESGAYSGSWPFFHAIDSLIRDTFPLKKQSPPLTSSRRRSPPAIKSPAWTVTPVAPRSGTQKRPAPGSVEDSYFRRSFLTFAAAAAAAAENGDSKGRSEKRRKRGRESDEEDDDDDGDEKEDRELGCRQLARAIERIGEIYERVEAAKRKQMVELEKQRMQFAKDLECQRMQLFMETQVHLLKIKRSGSKRDSAPDSFS